MSRRLERLLPPPLSHVAAVARSEAPGVVRRRRRVVGLTAVAGAALLGRSFSAEPDSARFYRSTAAVAATWALGGVLSGPLHLGWVETRDSRLRRPFATPVATGVGAFAVFYGGALVARRVPVLNDALTSVLRFAEEGDDGRVLATTLTNGLAEEVFFRGALYSALEGAHPVVASTGAYALVTTTTRNPALVLAATVMGALFALQRRASGGIQAPVITHVVWSALMVRFLPRLVRKPRGS